MSLTAALAAFALLCVLLTAGLLAFVLRWRASFRELLQQARSQLPPGRQGDVDSHPVRGLAALISAWHLRLEEMQRALHERDAQLSQLTTQTQAARTELAKPLGLLSQDTSSPLRFGQDQMAALARAVQAADELAQLAESAFVRAQALVRAADRSTQLGGSGRQALLSSLDHLRHAREQGEAWSEAVQGLTGQTQAVGDAVTVVRQVAKQSTLVALNASIEASRAGEGGRGFIVVANAVKALAAQSKDATGRMRRVLGEIQNVASDTSSLGESAQRELDSALENARRTDEVLRELSAFSSEASGGCGELARFAQAQEMALTRLRDAVGRLNDATATQLKFATQTEGTLSALRAVDEALSHATTSTGPAPRGEPAEPRGDPT